MMAGDAYIDVHIQVNPFISVSEGHFIATNVNRRLLNSIEQVKDVTVHVDPEDDEKSSPSFGLPSREMFEQKFITFWQSSFPEIQSWQLHYLDGKVTIELFCHKNVNLSELKSRTKEDTSSNPDILEVRVVLVTMTN